MLSSRMYLSPALPLFLGLPLSPAAQQRMQAFLGGQLSAELLQGGLAAHLLRHTGGTNMKARLPIYRGLALCLSSVLLQAVVPSLATAAAPTVMHSCSLTADYTFFGSSSDVEVSVGQGTNPGGMPTGLTINAIRFFKHYVYVLQRLQCISDKFTI